MKRLKTSFVLIAIVALWAGAAGAAYHHMDEKDAPKFQQAYPDLAGTKLDDCALCHAGNTYKTKAGNTVTESVCQFCHKTYGYDGSGDIVKTLNPYGAAYKGAGRSVAAFSSIENVDSDNDTYSNKAELDAIRYPGDSLDTPAKKAAPHIVMSLEEFESNFTAHEQFMLMNTSRGGEAGYDYYASYKGVIVEELLNSAGWRDNSSGITVTAPDGFCFTFDRTPDGPGNYYIEGAYPQAPYYFSSTASASNGGWVDYSAPGCLNRGSGQIITVEGGLRLLLAYMVNGAYMDVAYQDDQNKLVGEGPFRAVPPQWRPGYPDRQATSANPAAEPWPYDSKELYTDHNAGFSARGVAAIRVDPLPEGMTEYDWRNSQTDAGWNYLEQKKIVIYGNLKSGTVKGRVTTMLAQEPIANALVSCESGYEALTDENGEFSIQGVLSGQGTDGKAYSFNASAEGYRSAAQDVTVTENDNQTIEFSLVQGNDNMTLCPIRRINTDQSRITVFRQFRDKVLAKTAAGKKYILAYYRCAPEATLRILADGSLRAQAGELLQLIAEPAGLLAAGKPAVITNQQLQRITGFTAALKKGASPRLSRMLEKFDTDLQSGNLQKIVPFGIEK